MRGVKYMSDSGQIDGFVAAFAVERPGAATTTSEVHRRYVEWMARQGQTLAVMSPRRFNAALALDHGWRRSKSGGRPVWRNIALREIARQEST